MKLYAQGLARRLHEQRVGPLSEADGGPPERPNFPWQQENRQEPTHSYNGRATSAIRTSQDRREPTETDNGRDPSDHGSDPSRQEPTQTDNAAARDSELLRRVETAGGPAGSPSQVAPRDSGSQWDTAGPPAEPRALGHRAGANGANGANATNGAGAERLKPRDGANGSHVSSSRAAPASLSNHDGDAVLAQSTFDPRVAHKVKPLSQAQLNAVDLLVLGHSDSSAANHLGVHRTTVSNWRENHPAFRAELARRRQEVWGGAVERVRALLHQAVEEMAKQLKDEDKLVRFRAASRLLALARHFRPADEPTDVEGVLTLEARRLNVQKHELHPAQSLVYEVDRETALQFLMNRAREDFTVGANAKEALPHARESMEKGLLSSGL